MSKKLSRKLLKNLGKTINKYELIQENDRILIGVSGGKDSLTLLDLLAKRKRRVPVDHEIIAAFIEIEEFGHNICADEIKDICDKLGIKFFHKKINVDLEKDKQKDRCFVCSWHRRKALFKLCRELECNKLALGHHMDDIITTLFMNMTMQGNISTMPIKLSLFDGEIHLIRPLGEIEEQDIIEYSKFNRLNVQKQECIYSEIQMRERLQPFLKELYSMNLHVKKNIFRSMGHINHEYLL